MLPRVGVGAPACLVSNVVIICSPGNRLLSQLCSNASRPCRPTRVTACKSRLQVLRLTDSEAVGSLTWVPSSQERRGCRHEPVSVIEPRVMACLWLNDELGVREPPALSAPHPRNLVPLRS